MTPHFPFVAIAETVTIQDLLRDKPSLCLAILGAASFLNLKLQRTLGGLINGLIGARIVSGTFASLDMLQALLVHLAWYVFQHHNSSTILELTRLGLIINRGRDDTLSTFTLL